MKIAADTNVLVRFLTQDDKEQARRAAEVLDAAESVFIPVVVLCEVVWVLRRAYSYAPAEIASALRMLVESSGVEVDHSAVEAGLNFLASGGDFADGIILHDARRAKVEVVVSFDSGFAARCNGFVRDLGQPIPRA